MQKPKFRTVDKSAWVFITTRLNPTKAPTMSRRTALRCGYIAAAANRLARNEAQLPNPISGEAMSDYILRVKKG